MNKFSCVAALTLTLLGSNLYSQCYLWPIDCFDSRKETAEWVVDSVSMNRQNALEQTDIRGLSELTVNVSLVESFGVYERDESSSLGCALTGSRGETFYKKSRSNTQNYVSAGSNSYLSKLHSQVQLPRIGPGSATRNRRRVCSGFS